MCEPTKESEHSENSTKDIGSEETIQIETSGNESKPDEIPAWYTKLNVHEKSLEDQSNWFSDWFMFYLSPLLRLGASKVLQASDVGVPSERDLAGPTFDTMKKAWRRQMEKAEKLNHIRKEKYDAMVLKLSAEKRAKVKPFIPSEPGVATALFVGFGPWEIIWAIFYYVLSALLGFVPVLVLKDLVNYFSRHDYKTFVHPWFQVVLLGIVPLAVSLLQTRSQVVFQHFSVFARTAISTLLYEKALTVSAPGRACTSTGQVVNMMSNDTTQLQRFIQFGGMILVAPLQIIISLALIFREVGNATWVGVGFMIFLAPINVIVFSVVGNMRKEVLKYSDLRVKMMNEILAGIRIIKYYAWEKPFRQEVGKLRSSELKALTNLAYVSAVGFSLLMLSAPIIQLILVFYTYIRIQDQPLTASIAFTTVALFNIMRFPFAFLPMGMLQYIQSMVSLRRLAKYLQLPELNKYVITSSYIADADSTSLSMNHEIGSITIKDSTFSWTNKSANLKPIGEEESKKSKKSKKLKNGRSTHNSKSPSTSTHSNAAEGAQESNESREDLLVIDVPTLRNISISVKKGELVAVVGTVGSGKSSLLSAILGEMEPVGDAKVYVPKDESCSSSHFFSYCSQTPWVVNNTLRGNILFGRPFDEKRYQAVIEACALSDDIRILPAGDMTEIGERGINLSGGQKARVSLARALYSPETVILLMDDPLSAVDAHVGDHLFTNAVTGNLSQNMTRILVTHHVHFLPRCDKVIVLEKGEILHFGTYSDLIAKGVNFVGAVDMEHDTKQQKESSPADETNDSSGDPTTHKKTDKIENDELKKKGEKLITKEDRKEGSVSGQAYLHYARAGGSFKFFSMFFIQAAGRAAEIMGSFWLAIWATAAGKAFINGGGLTQEKTTHYLNIYALFGMLGVFGLTLRSLLMAWHRLYASRKLHDNLTKSILRAPVAFYDVNPVGRILNRFAADMDKIDLDLTQSISQGMGTIFSVLGAIGAIIGATKGTFLVLLFPMVIFYYYIQKWFRKTSTELQRLTSIAGSPIFSDFSQLLTGTSTIRAYNQQERFLNNCERSFDDFNASYNLVYLVNYWLGIRLDLLGGVIAAFIGGLALATSSSGFIPAGWLGLALSYAIEITGNLKMGVRMMATIEADMNSVERVLYYSDKIESESPDVIPDKDPNVDSWPSKGAIQFQGCSMRYRDGPLVLKEISFDVQAGEKIGVVGRTGSGKSSLMNALFRITELEMDGGKIIIDGVNISEIGTEVLRRNLSIIPQDPTMFSNTLRYNLDPFAESSDDEILQVLDQVQLKDIVMDLPMGLDQQIAEGGENFSQGQRQLICIARSLLRKPKILVMDEATASIDNSTDAAIQKMIRSNFSNATVLTIAHRLNTIMDSDRILVLDDGRIAEFDSPSNLLAMKDGLFRTMVERSRT